MPPIRPLGLDLNQAAVWSGSMISSRYCSNSRRTQRNLRLPQPSGNSVCMSASFLDEVDSCKSAMGRKRSLAYARKSDVGLTVDNRTIQSWVEVGGRV